MRQARPLIGALAAVAALVLAAPAPAAPGDPDPSFGLGGRVIATFSPLNQAAAQAVAIQRNNKIVTASGGGGLVVARFNANGTPDRTFAGDGVAIVRFGSGGDEASGSAVAIDHASGKIVVGGVYSKETSPPPDDETPGEFDNYWAFARLHANGRLDRSFSGDGKRTVRYEAGELTGVNDLAITPRGKVVAAGVGGAGFAVVRLRRSGRLDGSFSRDGKRSIGFFRGGGEEAYAVALRSRGRVVIAGQAARDDEEGDPTNDFAIAQLRRNGKLDRGFSGNGKFTTAFGPETGEGATDVRVDRDGRLVVAGTVEVGGFEGRVGVVRLTRQGNRDTSFDGDGRAMPSFGMTEVFGDAGVVLTGGRIVVGGTALVPPAGGTGSSDFRFGLVALTPNGALDSSFSGDGLQMTSLTPLDADRGNAVAARGGKIVLAGEAGSATGIVRYLGN